MYRKNAGEPQLTFNHVRALSDFMTNFTFSKGMSFKVNKMFQHITPALLQRIFDKDNNRQQFLWTMGQQGGVSGDCFVKVAYAEPNTKAADPITGRGRVMLLVLQPSHCFPEWDPHVPGKMNKFTMKYKFWGTQPDGTRVVNSYVEEITDEYIREYINDEKFRDDPNPLGRIPVVHIANVPISGSPWGLSDIDQIIPINREYNEKATDVSEIINYHASPITVVTGGHPPNLERGPAKIWGIGNEKAKVFNLEGGAAGLGPAMEYMEMLRMRMHEYGHVPANALGEPQPISNTSGVALAIQYMPTMMHYNLKKVQYGTGLQEIAQLALMTLFIKEPQSVRYDPYTDGILDETLSQQLTLNPGDPAVYDIDVEWPAPLPVDILIKLNEIQLKMELGIESRKGALGDIGEEFPDEKLQELHEEMMQDAKSEAELRVFNSQVAAAIMAITGIIPEGQGEPVPPEAPEPGNSGDSANAPQQVTAKQPQLPPGLKQVQDSLINEIVTNAFSPRVPLRRNFDRNDNDAASS